MTDLVQRIRIDNASYTIKDPNVYPSLTAAQRATLLSDGTYLGNAASAGDIFVNESGKMEELSVEHGTDPSQITLTHVEPYMGNTHTSPKTAAGNGMFIVTCKNSDKYAVLSDNATSGVLYTVPSNIASGSVKPIFFGGGKFIMTDGTNAAYSTDGTTWTQFTLPVDVDPVCYDNGTWYFLNSSGNMQYTTDFTNWSSSTVFSLSSTYSCHMVVVDGVYYVSGQRSGPDLKLFKSTDLSTWTEVQISGVSIRNDALMTDGTSLYMYEATKASYYKSSDGGATWTAYTPTDGNIYGFIIIDSTTFVMTLAGWSTQALAITVDGGSTWTTMDLTSTVSSLDSGPRSIGCTGSYVVFSAQPESGGGGHGLEDGYRFELTAGDTYSLTPLSYTKAEVDALLGTMQPALTAGTGITISSGPLETISVNSMSGATATTAGTAGIVPVPAAADNTKYLKGNGAWSDIDLEDIAVAGNGIELQEINDQNYEVIGEPTITSAGMLTNCSEDNYVFCDSLGTDADYDSTNTYELNFKFNTGHWEGTKQFWLIGSDYNETVFKFYLEGSVQNGIICKWFEFPVLQEYPTFSCQPDTDYWIKFRVVNDPSNSLALITASYSADGTNYTVLDSDVDPEFFPYYLDYVNIGWASGFDDLEGPSIDLNSITISQDNEVKYRVRNVDPTRRRIAGKPFTGTRKDQWGSYSYDGVSGDVPAPTYNDGNKFLKGDGTWSNICYSGYTNPAASIDAQAGQAYANTNTSSTWLCSAEPNRRVNPYGDEEVMIDSNNIASNFSASDYLQIPQATTNKLTEYFEVGFSFTSTSGDWQYVVGPMQSSGCSFMFAFGNDGTANTLWVWLSSNGTAWNIASNDVVATNLSLNTKYYVKLVQSRRTIDGGRYYDVSISSNGTTWSTPVSFFSWSAMKSTIPVYLGNAWDGNYYLKGSMDLKDAYIQVNGTEIWRGAGSIWNKKQDEIIAGVGLQKTGSVLEVTAPFLYNLATTDQGLLVGTLRSGAKTGYYSVSLGKDVYTAGDCNTAIGGYSKVYNNSGCHYGTAIGSYAETTAIGAIALGAGCINADAGTFKVGLRPTSSSSVTSYELLNSSGKVPVARYIDFTGADGTNAGAAGAVPAPTATDNTKFLKGDGTWGTPTDTTYSAFTGAGASAAGTSGLVPAPAAGDNEKFLRGDGTWATAGGGGGGGSASYSNGIITFS